MRVFSSILSTGAFIAVLLLTVYAWHTRRDLRATQQQLRDVQASIDDLRDELSALPAPARPASPPAAAAAQVPSPVQVAAPTPQPTGTMNPESLQHFVASEVSQERQRERQQREDDRQARARLFRAQIASRIGLSPDEGQRFETALTDMQKRWRDLMETVRTGQRPMQEVRPEIDALADTTKESLLRLMGTERLSKLREMDLSPQKGADNRWLFGLAGGPSYYNGFGPAGRAAGFLPPAAPTP
jgi:hypothetical protein